MIQGNAAVFLLQGLAGVGKSTFNRFLLRKLLGNMAWQVYHPGDPVPEPARRDDARRLLPTLSGPTRFPRAPTQYRALA